LAISNSKSRSAFVIAQILFAHPQIEVDARSEPPNPPIRGGAGGLRFQRWGCFTTFWAGAAAALRENNRVCTTLTQGAARGMALA
jgi:hypothetical protein